MKSVWIKPFLLLVTLFLSLSLERVIGVPLVSLIIFYHLFFKSPLSVSGVALFLFSLLISSLYTLDPVLTVTMMIVFFLIIKGTTDSMGSLLGWQSLSFVLIQALGVGYLAHLEINSVFLFAGFFQFAFSLFIIKKVIFKDIEQSFTWKEKVFSAKTYEKTV